MVTCVEQVLWVIARFCGWVERWLLCYCTLTQLCHYFFTETKSIDWSYLYIAQELIDAFFKPENNIVVMILISQSIN